MKLSITSAIIVTLLSGTTATSVSVTYSQADCFRDCEADFRSGSNALEDCRSDCRRDMTRSGRDYKNAFNPDYDDDDNRNNDDRRSSRNSRNNRNKRNSRNRNNDDRRSNRRDDDDFIRWDDRYNIDDATEEKAVMGALKHLAVGRDTKMLLIPIGLGPRKSVARDDDVDDAMQEDLDATDKKESKGKEDKMVVEPDEDEKDDKEKDDDDDKEDKDKKDDDDDDKDDKKDEDDDDDKKDDEDDDEKNKRTLALPECETDGTNYNRCDPDTVADEDEDTCEVIEDEVCDEKMDKEDEDYCECIGLADKKDKKRKALIRGVSL